MLRMGFLCLLLPVGAYAGDDFALTTVLNSLSTLLTGAIAKAIFMLAIIGVGYAWLYLGKMPTSRAMGVIIGIGIIYGASYLSKNLGV